MREFLYRLVQRLHDEARPLSRNKHFHAFGDAESRRALRIDRHLRDLETRLVELRERGEPPRVRLMPDGGVQLVLRHPDMSVVRTATLTAEEARLLARHPAGAWALGCPTAEQVSAAAARKRQ
ncbi:MAG TPA: hypothetical protein VEQ15_01475 [Myxococcales bacterium]|jgi:hypothetical protein|nr:hypothetical protein [Myxococcales bacterium]